ncbi:MAG TPA: hypothetical protein VMR98_02095 [Candidatus Polarisedimenticolaceae bacterium]|nr:hypothetical protein [Candidatus Polarisedimenticolaceae bacterium]
MVWSAYARFGRARGIAMMTLTVVVCFITFMPVVSQAATTTEAALAATKVAWGECGKAAKGNLVLVRGLPVSMELYECDGADAQDCSKRKRRGRVIYACIAHFMLKATLPVDSDWTYIECNNTVYVTQGFMGKWFRARPYTHLWTCIHSFGIRTGLDSDNILTAL